MKRILLFAITALVWCGCSKDDDNHPIDPSRLYSPELAVNYKGKVPYTGLLEVYPCNAGSSVYYGNYTGSSLTASYATYDVVAGTAKNDKNPVRLPVGTYNMVYWGIPAPDTDEYKFMNDIPAAITVGENLEKEYRTLRPYEDDTTYYPVFGYVFAVKPEQLGSQPLSASLNRVVSGLNITITNKDGKPFDPAISRMWVQIGSIAYQLNYFTALPQDQTKTVKFELTAASGNTQMISNTVMLFPSAPDPLFQLFVQLKNGKIKMYQQALTETLTAGDKINLSLTFNGIFSEEGETGSFEISAWNEEKETIDLPPL